MSASDRLRASAGWHCARETRAFQRAATALDEKRSPHVAQGGQKGGKS